MTCGVGCRHSSDPALLWLGRRLAATAPIRPPTESSVFQAQCEKEVQGCPARGIHGDGVGAGKKPVFHIPLGLGVTPFQPRQEWRNWIHPPSFNRQDHQIHRNHGLSDPNNSQQDGIIPEGKAANTVSRPVAPADGSGALSAAAQPGGAQSEPRGPQELWRQS